MTSRIASLGGMSPEEDVTDRARAGFDAELGVSVKPAFSGLEASLVLLRHVCLDSSKFLGYLEGRVGTEPTGFSPTSNPSFLPTGQVGLPSDLSVCDSTCGKGFTDQISGIAVRSFWHDAPNMIVCIFTGLSKACAR